MTGVLGLPAGGPPSTRPLVSWGLLAASQLALAAVAGVGNGETVVAVAVLLVGAYVASTVTRLLPVALVPAAVGLGIGLVSALTSPTSAALAGVAGLALVFWVSGLGSERPGPGARLPGLALPGLATALAVLLGLALPSSTEEVGVAGVLTAGMLLYLAWVVARAAPQDEGVPTGI